MSLKQDITIQRRVLIAGILLMVVKFFTWIITNSNAVLSDALESIVNIVAGSFALYSLMLSSRPRDKNHPYGHGKIEYISSSLEGFFIGLAGLSIVSKSVYNLVVPEDVEQVDLGIYLTVFTGGVNYLMGWFLLRTGKRKNSIVLKSEGKHLQSDGYTSLALILGLVVVYFTNSPYWDSIIALVFGIYILFTSYSIMKESLGGIMDEIDPEVLNLVLKTMNEHRPAEWIDLHNFRMIRFGQRLHIDCHVTLPAFFDLPQAHDEGKKIEDLWLREISDNMECFIHLDPCTPNSCPVCEVKNCPIRSQAFVTKLEWTSDLALKNAKHKFD